MAETVTPALLASALAAIGAAAFICAVFYPVIFRRPLVDKRSAVFESLLRGRTDSAVPTTRSVRRAQEAALKSVSQHGKTSRASQLENRLTAAGVTWSPRFYLALCFGLGTIVFCAGGIAGLSLARAITLALISAWFLPRRYLDYLSNRRKRAFLNAFSPAIDMIVRGAKSGLSMMDCLAMVATDAAPPVNKEFEGLVAQLRAGVPVSAAMERLAAAMPLPEIRFFVMIMSAQSQTGGNLTDALANLSGVLRDREKIAGKVRIASAEGRASALIIGALPFLVIGGTAAFAPDYISVLWTDQTGRWIGLICTIWLATGIFVLGRMARVEV